MRTAVHAGIFGTAQTDGKRIQRIFLQRLFREPVLDVFDFSNPVTNNKQNKNNYLILKNRQPCNYGFSPVILLQGLWAALV